ncbi:MAG: 50S ribosomal protein L3 [candidate division WOR-3 bacterium]
MIKGLIGRKIGMTHLFDQSGALVPVTLLKVGPCYVTQLRSPERDGYHAVQVGFEEVPKRKLNKPRRGHLARAGLQDKPVRYLAEFPPFASDLQLGQTITVDQVFQVGERVKVTGISKGKGTAGVVRRYHAAGGPKTHGSMTHRRPLASGATGPQRVLKTKPMPGRMGAKRVTQTGLTVVQIDVQNHTLALKGAVPGPNGGVVYIRKTTP